MLLFKTYKREELIKLFGTNRIDAIKNKLDRNGYIYTTSGRGNDLTITVSDCTKAFETFCKEELGFAAQTNFEKLKVFLRRLFFDEEFCKLPFAAMQREIGISEQTISKWVKHLVDNDLIVLSIGEFNYYLSRRIDMTNFETIELTEQEYKDAWKAYWEGREDGYTISFNRMYYTNGGTPHKRGVMFENAFEMEKLEKLKELLKEN